MDDHEKLAIRAVVKSGLVRSAHEVRVHPYASGLFTILRVDTPNGSAAVKLEPTDVCRAEVEGLEALRSAGAPVPAVLAVEEEGAHAAFVMEFLQSDPKIGRNGNLVAGLGALYKTEFDTWGWPRWNFIGSLPQPNQQRSSFEEHWLEDRIRPQLEFARNRRLVPSTLGTRIEKVTARRASDWGLNDVTPRLIHGDLWAGNVLSSGGRAVLVDPAVARGHPEQDLAMLDLFGSSCTPAEMRTIRETAGLPPGREERVPFFQIYPLLVHVNIFGSSYIQQLGAAVSACE